MASNSRRSFLKSSVAALGTLAVPQTVHAGVSEELKVGLIGCGNRGAGAASDALLADPLAKLTAVADVFPDAAQATLKKLQRHEKVGSRVTVTPEHVFTGFDAYRHLIDSGVDVVLLATPPHFRPAHLAYAVEQGKHTFVEKPVAVDVPGVHQVRKTCHLAREKGLAIVSGLCWRYDDGVRATIDKVKNGAIGRIIAIESSYNTGSLWHRGEKPNWSRLEYQLRNWLYYTWLSGDHIVEQAVHSIDKTAWLLGDISPLRAVGSGGRQQRTAEKYGNIYDHFTVSYEYPDDVKVFFTCRQQARTKTHVDELVLGTQGQARILKQKITGEEAWSYKGKKQSMYLREHQELFKSIRDGQPINDGHYMCNSTLIAIMGRICAYTGQELSWEKINKSTQRLGPDSYVWGDVPEPPVPIPGKTKFI